MKKLELHTHTKYSTDSITDFNDIIESCQNNNIAILAVTDHNQIEGALRLKQIAPFEVIIGEEILTNDGEIIGLFLNELIPPGLPMEETIKLIKKQGGVVYLPHPFDKTTRRTSIKESKIEEFMDDIDIVEVYNGRTILPWDNVKAKNLAAKYGKIAVVGSDTHTKFEYGRNYQEITGFKNRHDFLKGLRSANKKTSIVLYWVFLLTKWARLINRRKNNDHSRKIIFNKSCDICGSEKSEFIYKKNGRVVESYKITDNSYGVHHQIVKCLGCNLIFAYPVDEESKVSKRYNDFIDPDYEFERVGRSQNQLGILNNINKLFPSKGKLLDVGCATGAFLEIAKKDGWDILGIEPSKWAADVAREKYNLPVLHGTLDDLKVKEGSFDVVVCLDVIEHVNSPRKLLNGISKFLKPGGLLCMVTPDKDSLVAKLLNEKWWHVRSDHIFYFCKETISLLLLSEGFKIASKSYYSWNFSYDYWVSRFVKNLPLLYKFAHFFKKLSLFNFITKRNYTINFRDSMELYCFKDVIDE